VFGGIVQLKRGKANGLMESSTHSAVATKSKLQIRKTETFQYNSNIDIARFSYDLWKSEEGSNF
jgi:hypothetical protein